MRTRAAPLLAWSVAAVCVVVMALALLVYLLTPRLRRVGPRLSFIRSSRFSRCRSRRSVPWSSLDTPTTR
jgi:hypothetical protein